MNTERQTRTNAQGSDIRQRAKASRASARHLLEASEGIGPVPNTCAASRLSDLLEKAWIRRDELDEWTTPENRPSLEPLERHVMRQIDDLELAISYVRAASPAGVLAQLAIASDALELATNGSDDSICASGQERVERCLYSVAAAICAWTGSDRDGFCLRRYLPTRCDELGVLDGDGAGQ